MASDKKKSKGKQPAKALLRDGPNWPLFALAVLGMILSAYLTYTAWAEKLVAFCVEGSGCDVVLNSRWSTLVRHADFVLGIVNLRPARRGGLEPLRGQPMALGLGDLALRSAF